MRSNKCLSFFLVIIALSFLLVACNDTSNENVIVSADNVVQSVNNFDVDLLALQTVGDVELNRQQIMMLFNPTMDAENEQLAFNAIKNTFLMEIIEGSVNISADRQSASIDVKTSFVDYYSIMEIPENMTDIDVFINALATSEERLEKVTTLTFVLDGETWLLSNLEPIENVISFTELNIEIVPNLVDCVVETEWWYTDDGSVSEDAIYTNTELISLHVIPTDNEVMFDYRYNVYLDGELVYESDEIYSQHGYIEARYSYDFGALLYPYHGEELFPGEYRIEVFDLNETMIASNVCEVIIKDIDNIRIENSGASNIVFTDTPFNIEDLTTDRYEYCGLFIPEIYSLAAYCNTSNVNPNTQYIENRVYREYYFDTYIDSGYCAHSYEEAEDMLGIGDYETSSIDELHYRIQVVEGTTQPLTIYLYYYNSYEEFVSSYEETVLPEYTDAGVFYDITIELPEDIMLVDIYACDENGDVMIHSASFEDCPLRYQVHGF